jgi:hypothetical protein
MIVRAALRTAREAGVSVAATALGTLKVSGDTSTIARLASAWTALMMRPQPD